MKQDVGGGRNMVDGGGLVVDNGRKPEVGEVPEIVLRLEQKRNRKGLSIRRTARTIGISHPTLIRLYKTGKIGYQTLHKVEQWLGKRSEPVADRSRNRFSKVARLVMTGYYKMSISCDVQ